MTGVEIVSSVVEILVSGITGIASGVGEGLSSLASAIFMTGEAGSETLSIFGTLIIVFAGISLAIGLCRWVLNFLTSLGARDR